MTIYGILLCVVRSFGIYETIGLNNITIKYILKIIFDKKIMISLLNTFLVAFVSAIVSVIIGILISVYLIKNNIKNIKILYSMVPIPHIVVAMMFILLFSQNGFISRLFFHMGLIKDYIEFPIIIYDKYNIGVILAYIFKSVAYVLSTIYILLYKTNIKYYEVGCVMGISLKQFVLDILIPINFSAISSTCLILFSYIFGAYEIPYLLSNSYNKLFPVIAYEKYINPSIESKPEFYAMNFIMLIVGIIIILIYKKIIERDYDEKYII